MPRSRKLGRPTAHRKAMIRGMVTYILENGSIETTLTRAKDVQSMTEKMITLGKANTLASRRAALAFITKEDVVTKLFTQIAPKYAEKNGGYTTVYKLGPRRGDAAEMALIKLTEVAAPEKEKATKAKAPAKRTTAKKPAAKKAEPKTEAPAEETAPAEDKAE